MKYIAPEKIKVERLKICYGCPSLIKGTLLRCRECGCPIKTKTMISSSSCPVGKWAAFKDQT